MKRDIAPRDETTFIRKPMKFLSAIAGIVIAVPTIWGGFTTAIKIWEAPAQVEGLRLNQEKLMANQVELKLDFEQLERKIDTIGWRLGAYARRNTTNIYE